MKCPKLACFCLLAIFLISTLSALAAGGGPPFDNLISSPAESSAARFPSPGFSSVSISDAPRLTFTRKDGEIVVGWPLDTPGWVLEQSPHLHLPIPWTPVSPTLFQMTETNLSLNVSLPVGNMFYRLRKIRPVELVPGLTGAWTMDEGQGGAAQDSSGSGASLVLSNATWMPGRIGAAALWFDGTPAAGRAWVSNANYSVLPPSGRPFSVSLWFSPDLLTIGWRGLIGNDANGSNGWHVALHNSGPGTNELVFAGNGPDATLNVTGRKLLLPGRWYEMTATFDGNDGSIYLDGELLARNLGTIHGNDDPIYVGGGVGGYDNFLGGIDEVRCYTNALAPESICLVGEWRFDENGGKSTLDTSLQGHHATVFNSSDAWSPGKSGSGINLSNSAVVIPNDSLDVLPPTGGPFSISFWLHPHCTPAGWSGLMSCADDTNTGWNLALYGEVPGKTWLNFCSTNTGCRQACTRRSRPWPQKQTAAAIRKSSSDLSWT